MKFQPTFSVLATSATVIATALALNSAYASEHASAFKETTDISISHSLLNKDDTAASRVGSEQYMSHKDERQATLYKSERDDDEADDHMDERDDSHDSYEYQHKDRV